MQQAFGYTRRKLVHYNWPLRLGHLAIATHARKMHKNLFVVVHPEVLDND
jgi:hypothetical protein